MSRLYKIKDRYILICKASNLLKKDLTILHTLPRVMKISMEVDNEPQELGILDRL